VAIVYLRVFIIIDVLNKYQISDGYRQRFLLGLFNIQEKYGVNLFVTLQLISSIENQFEGKSKLEIRASKEDVQKYLDNYIFWFLGFVTRSLEL